MEKEEKYLWKELLGGLRSKIGEENFNIWIKPLRFESLSSDKLIIQAPSQFFVERIQERYLHPVSYTHLTLPTN